MRLSLRDPDVIVLGWLPEVRWLGQMVALVLISEEPGVATVSPSLSVPIHEGSSGPAFPIELVVLPSPSSFCSPQDRPINGGDELLESRNNDFNQKASEAGTAD